MRSSGIATMHAQVAPVGTPSHTHGPQQLLRCRRFMLGGHILQRLLSLDCCDRFWCCPGASPLKRCPARHSCSASFAAAAVALRSLHAIF